MGQVTTEDSLLRDRTNNRNVYNEGTKVLGASVMYIVIYNTRQYYYAYADKCVSVRGSIPKFGKDESSS